MNFIRDCNEVVGALSHHEDPAIDLVEVDTRKHKLLAILDKVNNIKPSEKKEEAPADSSAPSAPEGDKEEPQAENKDSEMGEDK